MVTAVDVVFHLVTHSAEQRTSPTTNSLCEEGQNSPPRLGAFHAGEGSQCPSLPPFAFCFVRAFDFGTGLPDAGTIPEKLTGKSSFFCGFSVLWLYGVCCMEDS